MNKLIFSLLIAASSFANAAEVIDATHRPTNVSPASITHFTETNIGDAIVSTVASLIGGAWLAQEVIISVGLQEEGQESFTYPVTGEVIKTQTYNHSGGFATSVTTDSGPWSEEKGVFLPGFTVHTLTVKRQPNSDTGYANKGSLVTTYYTEQN